VSAAQAGAAPNGEGKNPLALAEGQNHKGEGKKDRKKTLRSCKDKDQRLCGQEIRRLVFPRENEKGKRDQKRGKSGPLDGEAS